MSEKKIIIVDDDESIRKTFFLILNKNYRVYLAKDSGEALQRFKLSISHFFVKPLDLDSLNRSIDHLLNSKKT